MSESESVKLATTQKEREAIYRFRYEVYVEELNRDYPDADHERKWLRDEDDLQDYALNLYMGPLDQIVAVVRVLVWPGGTVPEKYHRMFSMDIIPGIEDLVTCEIGRLMIRPSLRGKSIFPTLMDAMYEHLVARDVALCFLYCVPGLVKHYRKTIGARPYGGHLIPAGSSTGIPLMVIVSGSKYFAACGATFAEVSRKYFGPGQRPELDISPFRHVLEGDSVPVNLDETAVWTEFKHHLLEDESSMPTVMSSLAPESIKTLTSSGFTLDLSRGDVVARSGTEEREVYIILSGVFEVVDQGQRLAILEKGDLFGEIAFFTEAGQRSASVRALGDAQLLVLRRSFLEELNHSDPAAGFQILMNMGRVMAMRIMDLNHALVAARRGD